MPDFPLIWRGPIYRTGDNMARKFFRRRRSSGGRRYRGRSRSGRNISLASIGVGCNAAVQLGIPDAVGLAMDGDFKGAINRMGQQDAGSILLAAGPAVGLALAKKFIGSVPLIKIGSWRINLL